MYLLEYMEEGTSLKHRVKREECQIERDWVETKRKWKVEDR
jgi:hypothetical protein